MERGAGPSACEEMNKAMLPVFLTMSLLAIGATVAGASNYYVAGNGADANDGRSPGHPWRTLERVNRAHLVPGDKVVFRRGDVWRGSLRPASGADGRPVVYGAYGAGPKPVLMGSVAMSTASDWHSEGGSVWWAGGTVDPSAGANAESNQPPESDARNAASGPLPVDVGNLIFGSEAGCGWKVWRREDVNAPGRFWYDARTRRLYLYSDTNPAEKYGRVECALYRHIVAEDGCSHVVYKDLALKYGGAHGIGGGNTHHIVARNLEISYIGGADQFGDGQQVRFGNGIEFWGNARDNLVENCRLWEIYDAALTNQNLGEKVVQANITYRDNTIWNSEYSFEYWNRPAESVTENIRFIHNTCVNAGHGWAHAQRPDPSGRHLCLYASEARESGIVIADNIFDGAADNAFYAPDWLPEALARLRVDGNLWRQDQGAMASITRKFYPLSEFERYRSATGFDAHSLTGDPLFRDPARHDYRLKPGSPCRGAAVNVEGGAGARSRQGAVGRAADIGAR